MSQESTNISSLSTININYNFFLGGGGRDLFNMVQSYGFFCIKVLKPYFQAFTVCWDQSMAIKKLEMGYFLTDFVAFRNSQIY